MHSRQAGYPAAQQPTGTAVTRMTLFTGRAWRARDKGESYRVKVGWYKRIEGRSINDLMSQKRREANWKVREKSPSSSCRLGMKTTIKH